MAVQLQRGGEQTRLFNAMVLYRMARSKLSNIGAGGGGYPDSPCAGCMPTREVDYRPRSSLRGGGGII